MTDVEKLASVLIRQELTLAVAESCTGGKVSALLVSVPGISKVFLCGTVAYSNAAKIGKLGVPTAVINTEGAVSADCAMAMAEGARRESGAVLGVATTGIAGPGGGTADKPVGLVYIGIAGRKTAAHRFMFNGTREDISTAAADKAIELLLAEAEGFEYK